MARDQQGRLNDDGDQKQHTSGLVPQEVANPDTNQNPPDADWLTMTTADPAFFLKDTNPE